MASTLAMILVFATACYLSFKAGMNFGQFKLFRALSCMPDELRNDHFAHYKQQMEKAKKEAE